MKIFDQLDTLTKPFLDKFASQIESSSYILATPSFVINKASYLEAARDYLADRLLAKFPHLEGALENMSEKKMLTKEQMGSMIVIKRGLAGEASNSQELDFLALPKLASIAKQHAVVSSFNSQLMEATLNTDSSKDSQKTKEDPNVQKLAATFILLEKLHPQSASLIRGSLYNPPLNQPKVADAVTELARNPSVAVLKYVNKSHPEFLREHFPSFHKKMGETDATGTQFGASNRDRTADLDNWSFAPPASAAIKKKY